MRRVLLGYREHAWAHTRTKSTWRRLVSAGVTSCIATLRARQGQRCGKSVQNLGSAARGIDASVRRAAHALARRTVDTGRGADGLSRLTVELERNAHQTATRGGLSA
jgi:NADPH-dependent reductive aminase-like protein